MTIFEAIFLAITIFFYPAVKTPPPDSFQASKKIVREIFQENPVTLYCRCKYDEKNRIDLSSCSMSSAAGINRAAFMELEHMMPADNFGKQFRCWKEPVCHKGNGKKFKGRKCCQKTNAGYRKAEAELYNLWPSVGLINQMRANYRFAELDNKKTIHGCNFTIDYKERKVEPPDSAKGIVARANLFMADHYHVHLSKSQRQLFMVWNHQFPPDDWEKAWAKRVADIEGYANPYIT